MPSKNKRIIPVDGSVFHDIANQIKLIFRLMSDPRVSPILKLLPVGSFIYLIFPDLLPLNPLDDAIVVGLGTYLFVELCPPEIVQEHKDALEQVIPGKWQNGPADTPLDFDEGEVVEGEFREK